jgi:hypothetical protein
MPIGSALSGSSRMEDKMAVSCRARFGRPGSAGLGVMNAPATPTGRANPGKQMLPGTRGALVA